MPGLLADYAAGDDQPRPDQLTSSYNSFFGTPGLRGGAAAIDQGVPVSTCCHRACSRSRSSTPCLPDPGPIRAREEYDDLRGTMANGMRQILLLLIRPPRDPGPVGREMTRLVYQRGEFDAAQDPGSSPMGCVLVLVLIPSTASSCADPDLLQPAAPLGADLDLGGEPWRSTALAALALYRALRSRGIVRRHGDRAPNAALSVLAEPDPASRAARIVGPPHSGWSRDPDHRTASGVLRGRLPGLCSASRRARAQRDRAGRLAGPGAWSPARYL